LDAKSVQFEMYSPQNYLFANVEMQPGSVKAGLLPSDLLLSSCLEYQPSPQSPTHASAPTARYSLTDGCRINDRCDLHVKAIFHPYAAENTTNKSSGPAATEEHPLQRARALVAAVAAEVAAAGRAAEAAAIMAATLGPDGRLMLLTPNIIASGGERRIRHSAAIPAMSQMSEAIGFGDDAAR
jgi:hypothetical protein